MIEHQEGCLALDYGFLHCNCGAFKEYLEDETMWTNMTLRKHLGERGFIEKKPPSYIDEGLKITRWHRDGEEITLFETLEKPPSIVFHERRIDPDDIGWRNINTQTGNRS